MPEVITEEVVVLLDVSGRPSGTMSKLNVHSFNTPLHSAFSVFLFNKDGYMLAQRRALSKPTWPGVWSNACCGHPGPGESHFEAAYRRIEYELGIQGVRVEMVLPKFRYRAENDGIVENEICPVMVGYLDDSTLMYPHSEEVEELRWIPWKDFLMADPSDPTCPYGAFSPWSLLEAKALADSSRFAEVMEAMDIDLESSKSRMEKFSHA